MSTKTKKAAESTIRPHSSYWLNDDIWDTDDDDLSDSQYMSKRESDMLRLLRLASVRKAIGNFVRILTNKNIPVKFGVNGSSYTDGESVVISAETSQNKFDIMVGLALHEGSHVLLSDFELVKHIAQFSSGETMITGWAGAFPKEIVEVVHRDPSISYTVAGYIKDIMNILEDRRIDKLVYQNAPGYRPYYDALYTQYFFTKEIGKNLQFNPEWREIAIENYINRLLLSIHPQSDPTALPGLDKIIKMADFDTIERVAHIPRTPTGKRKWSATNQPKFTDYPTLWQDACNILVEILKYVSFSSDSEIKNLNEVFSEPVSSVDGEPIKVEEVVQQEPEVPQNKRDGTFNPTRGKKDLDKLKEVFDGDLKKKKLSVRDEQSVSSIEQANADLAEIDVDGAGKTKVLVTKKVTLSMMYEEWFIFGNTKYNSPYTANGIVSGRKLGAILAHRLQVRNDPLLTKNTRLPHGKIDRRLLAQLGVDNTSVFHKMRVDMHRPAMLHLSLDASGSMVGKKWEKVVTTAVALAYAATKVRNLNVVISLRGGNNIPLVSIIHDSRKTQFSQFLQIMKHLSPAGSTPEGLCFEATRDLIKECAGTHDVYFINFSDGEPAFYNTSAGVTFSYGGQTAVQHTKKIVNEFVGAGIKVMSYFIEDSEYHGWRTNGLDRAKSDFRGMYGEFAEFVNVENATEVVRTLNKLLLARGA